MGELDLRVKGGLYILFRLINSDVVFGETITTLYKSCWHQDPQKRPTFDKIVQVLHQAKLKIPPEL